MDDHAEIPEALLRSAYAAFNARELDAAVAFLDPNVLWANGLEGGHVQGAAGVRAYWAAQWEVIDPQVEPQAFEQRPDGRIAVLVHQVVRTIDGELRSDALVRHVYSVRDGRVARMDIEAALDSL